MIWLIFLLYEKFWYLFPMVPDMIGDVRIALSYETFIQNQVMNKQI